MRLLHDETGDSSDSGHRDGAIRSGCASGHGDGGEWMAE
jgi:hypothetical protein